MPPIKTIQVYLNTPEGIINFKEWFKNTFPLGTVLYFKFYCLEESISANLRNQQQQKLYRIFNNSNYNTLLVIGNATFISIFQTEVNLNTVDLLIEFWKYYYSISFFVPLNDLTFEEFKEYETLKNPFEDDFSIHKFEDFESLNDPLINGFYKNWLWHKLADRVYTKNLGGEELIISSYAFNI